MAEARARTAIGVAMLDQQSCDAGSWLLASELSLEPPPPYHAFAVHQSPGPWEVQHTRLIDDRWFELALAKLRVLADYQEKRAKLSAAKTKNVEEQPSADPKKPPKPGKGDKGKGKGAKSTGPTVEPPAPST